MEKEVKAIFSEKVLAEAFCRFELDPRDYQELDGFENFIYEVKYEGEPAVMRLSHSSKKDEKAVHSELAYLDYLASHQAGAAQPYRSANGLLTEQIAAEDGSYFTAVCFEKAPGRHPEGDDFCSSLFKKWGAAMGRMHRLSKSYRAPQGLERIHWFEEVEVTRAAEYLPKDHKIVVEKGEYLAEKVASLPKDRTNYGVVHNDLHPYNFLYDGERITMIDFEDSVQMWYLSDIATSLFMVTVWPPNRKTREGFACEMLPPFLDGYRSENDLPKDWREQMDLFLKFREHGIYVAMYRASDMDDLHPWAAHYLNGRRERIENDVPYLDLDWGTF